MKKIFILLFLSPLLISEQQILTKVEDSCCTPSATFINFESSNSVDGISFKGVLNPKFVGDKWNYITGKGLITFIRQSDQKTFTIKADNFGFRPGDEFTELFIDGPPGQYKIPDPIKIEINKIPIYASLPGLPAIEIKNDILKITCLWCFARGYSKQEVYKIINTKNEFDYQSLYTLPENAVWDGEDSFKYSHTGNAVSGGESTIAKVNGYWLEVKRTSYDCYDYGYKEWKFNEDSKTLDLIIHNKNWCNLDDQKK